MPELRKGSRTDARLIVVSDFAEGIDTRRRGHGPNVWIESVRSILAGNVQGLCVDAIEVTAAAQRHPDFERVRPALDALQRTPRAAQAAA